MCPCPDELTAKTGSPGLLLPGEWLIHLLFEGDNWDDGIKNAVIVKRLKESELSVARRSHCDPDIINAEVVAKRTSANAAIKFVGAVKAECGVIRKLMAANEAERIFCAFDDPVMPNFPGHALIGFSSYPKGDYWTKRNTRTACAGNLILEFEKAGAPLTLESCFV